MRREAGTDDPLAQGHPGAPDRLRIEGRQDRLDYGTVVGEDFQAGLAESSTPGSKASVPAVIADPADAQALQLTAPMVAKPAGFLADRVRRARIVTAWTESSRPRSAVQRAIGPRTPSWGRKTSSVLFGIRPRRAQAQHVVPGGGVAQRAAMVAAIGERDHAERQRHPGPAARAAAGLRRVVGIAGRAEDRVWCCASRGRIPARWSCRSGSHRRFSAARRGSHRPPARCPGRAGILAWCGSRPSPRGPSPRAAARAAARAGRSPPVPGRRPRPRRAGCPDRAGRRSRSPTNCGGDLVEMGLHHLAGRDGPVADRPREIVARIMTRSDGGIGVPARVAAAEHGSGGWTSAAHGQASAAPCMVHAPRKSHHMGNRSGINADKSPRHTNGPDADASGH